MKSLDSKIYGLFVAFWAVGLIPELFQVLIAERAVFGLGCLIWAKRGHFALNPRNLRKPEICSKTAELDETAADYYKSVASA